MKRIAFMAHGPASGNVLKPLIERCRTDAHFSIDLYAFHPYVAALWQCEERDKETYLSLFEVPYDYLFYGTGSGHDMELMAAYHAKEHQITSVSILDAFWSSVDNLRLRFKHAPDVLIVPEESSRKNVIEHRIMPADKVFAFGNPHFDRLKAYQMTFPDPTPPYDIVVFSQPSATSDYSDTAEEVKACLQALRDLHKTTTLINSITVTPHPREDTTWLTTFCRENQYVLETKQTSFAVLLETDISVGVDCTLQYEALMIGKPTIFYQDKVSLHKVLCTPGFWRNNRLVMTFDATDVLFDWLKNHGVDE